MGRAGTRPHSRDAPSLDDGAEVPWRTTGEYMGDGGRADRSRRARSGQGEGIGRGQLPAILCAGVAHDAATRRIAAHAAGGKARALGGTKPWIAPHASPPG